MVSTSRDNVLSGELSEMSRSSRWGYLLCVSLRSTWTSCSLPRDCLLWQRPALEVTARRQYSMMVQVWPCKPQNHQLVSTAGIKNNLSGAAHASPRAETIDDGRHSGEHTYTLGNGWPLRKPGRPSQSAGRGEPERELHRGAWGLDTGKEERVLTAWAN